MSDMPNKIMVWHGPHPLPHAGSWATTRYPMEAEEYVRVAALPDMVKPLEWGKAHDNGSNGLCIVAHGKPYMGRYNIEWWSDKVLLMVAGGEWVEYPTIEAAKAAAQAHFAAQSVSAFGVQGGEA